MNKVAYNFSQVEREAKSSLGIVPIRRTFASTSFFSIVKLASFGLISTPATTLAGVSTAFSSPLMELRTEKESDHQMMQGVLLRGSDRVWRTGKLVGPFQCKRGPRLARNRKIE
jgi:hypothetical protein